MRARAGLALAAAVLSCGAGTPDPAEPRVRPAGTCRVTLTGAVEADFDCAIAYMSWGAEREGRFQLTTFTNATGYVANADISFVGEPHGPFSVTESGPRRYDGVVAVLSNGPIWGLDPSQPSYTLTISDPGPLTVVSQGELWLTVHGTLAASVTDRTDAGSTGSIAVNATF